MSTVAIDLPKTISTHSEVLGPIKVALLADGDVTRWDEFVTGCAEATFFHLAGWKTVLEQCFSHRTYFFFAECDGKIVGVLPLAEVKSMLFGHSLCSLPFCVYGGIAATSDAARLALDQAAQEMARSLNVEHLEYRSIHASHPAWAHKQLYVTFRKELLADDEQNMLAIPRKQRAMVRKGIKAELRGEIDGDVERFFEIYADSVHRHGTPALPKRYFHLLKKTFGDDCEVLSIISPSGKPVSSVLTFYFRNEVLPYYAGDHLEARDIAANDFKYWDLMQRAAARGCNLFDYGRSKIGTGPYHFKKNWGFEPAPLNYEYQLHRATKVPDMNPLNPKYRMFIKAWQTMPLSMANLIGPHIVKYLG